MARRSVVQALYQWELTGQVGAGIEDSFLNDWGLEGVDQEYFKQLVQGILKYTAELDRVLEKCLDRDLASVDPIERIVLRIGTYELQFRPEIPVRVVLNEAIELARVFGAEEGYRFVNGVLDRCQKLCRRSELPVA
ncbi:MAG: transcription antitermination factor NusB [Gemmatimonadetes bacterium]|nr:transcription antitermination factor NusB [Gemmatimonadota bacterium]